MPKNVPKLCSICGMLEMLSRMEGCTITSDMTSLLIDSVEVLDSVIAELLGNIPDEGK